MKKIVFLTVLSIFLTGSVIFNAACGQDMETSKMGSNEMPMNMDHNGMDHGEAGKKEETADFGDQRNDQTSAVIDAYNEIKTATEADDKDGAAKGAKSLIAALEKFDSSNLDASKRKEFTEIIDSAKEHAEHIVKSDVKHQKEHLVEATTDIKDLFALVGASKDD